MHEKEGCGAAAAAAHHLTRLPHPAPTPPTHTHTPPPPPQHRPLRWILPANWYAGYTPLADIVNGRSKLFWVATLLREPRISAYMEGLDTFPCTGPNPPKWCRDAGYTSAEFLNKATFNLCAIVNDWNFITNCGGNAQCINSFVY